MTGCTIHGYDHTIPEKKRNDFADPENNFFIYPLGVGIDEGNNLTTFQNILQYL